MGYLDEQGRLWFCGRKSHRIYTSEGMKCSIPCEAIFNQHPAVKRSALIEMNKEAIIIIERVPEAIITKDLLIEELLILGRNNELTKEIKTVLFHKSFPVDVRHNIKVDRVELQRLATEGKL